MGAEDTEGTKTGDVVPFQTATGGGAATIPPTPPAPPASGMDPGDAFNSEDDADKYLYEELGGRFWLKNPEGVWVDLSEAGFKRHLRKSGLRDKANPAYNQLISEVDEKLSEVEQSHRVAFAGILAGYRSGIHTITGRRVLVAEDPLIIEPKKGEWPVLKAFFEGLFCGTEPANEDGKTILIDQRPWFFGWLQHAVDCFLSGRAAPGLAVCVAGEPNSGKSFLALILRWCLGGRVAKPYSAMIGRDNFNKDLVEAVLQLVDDENQADTRLDARLKFAGEIKKMVANNEFRVRAMHRDGFTVQALMRLVVLVNLQANRLMVLPPLDGDVNDKLDLFKAYARPRPKEPITLDTPSEDACWPAPMPTRTEAEKEAYRSAVQAELPAFLYWLVNEFKMPNEVSGGRFVVRHYHHPAIVNQLHEFSPHLRIWDLMIRSKKIFHVSNKQGGGYSVINEWIGPAAELERLLTCDTSHLTLSERHEIPKPNWLGQRLVSITEHFGEDHCSMKVVKNSKRWTLRLREEDQEAAL